MNTQTHTKAQVVVLAIFISFNRGYEHMNTEKALKSVKKLTVVSY